MEIELTACFATVSSGPLRGFVQDGVRRFLGVPYAAPPVGPRRFTLPEPAIAWTEERDATSPGPTPPQQVIKPFGALDNTPLMVPRYTQGDDYLTLNVWRPDDDREALPIMVYIHGGGFITGSKDILAIDGSAFARDGVVCININYRLGIEGFLPIPGIPTNLGLRDQIAALQWVQQNAPAFGGDPAKVTIAGESGGAVCVACLVASPLARGLFHRAILQSGLGIVRDPSVALKVVKHMASTMKITPDAAGFRSLSREDTLTAMKRVQFARIDLRNADGVDPSMWTTRMMPVHGDDVVPEFPINAASKGAGAEVDLLISTCREEMNAFTVPLGLHRWMPRWLAKWLLGWLHPNAVELLKSYGLGQRGISAGKAFSDAVTDAAVRCPTRHLAERHRGKVHIVEFDWRSPALGGELGAAHGIALPFAFDRLSVATGPRGLLGTHPPQDLADRFHTVWVRFIRGESPGWPAFDAEQRKVYSLVENTATYESLMEAAKFCP